MAVADACYGVFVIVFIVAKVDKGAWRMPWLTEAMKDATSCENPRLGAHDR